MEIGCWKASGTASRRRVHAARVRAVREVEPGAYILLLHLPRALTFARGGLEHLFLPGWYAYAGSAYGPGGLGGRIRRHLRPDKTPHWHIDSLTNVADEIRVIAVPDGNECELGRGIVQSGMFVTALTGFGSSDCRSCETHLFRANCLQEGEGEGDQSVPSGAPLVL